MKDIIAEIPDATKIECNARGLWTVHGITKSGWEVAGSGSDVKGAIEAYCDARTEQLAFDSVDLDTPWEDA